MLVAQSCLDVSMSVSLLPPTQVVHSFSLPTVTCLWIFHIYQPRLAAISAMRPMDVPR